VPRGIRVYQLAREFQIGTDEVLRLLAKDLHIEVGSHMASVDDDVATRVRALAARRAGGGGGAARGAPAAAGGGPPRPPRAPRGPPPPPPPL